MVFKINMGTKSGKTYKIETESVSLLGKKIHDKIQGIEVSPDLEGYEFEIMGASDKSGFTVMEDVEGIGVKKMLLTYGKAMKRKPKREGKKQVGRIKPKGLRLRKTVRGNTISEAIVQINLKVLKEGNKKLSEIFAEQNKSAEPEHKPKEEATETTSKPTNNQQQKTSDESLTDKDNSEPQGRANEKKE